MQALAGVASDAGIAGLDTSQLVTETPPRPDMGDIAFPMFPFARVFRKAPPAVLAHLSRLFEKETGPCVIPAAPTISTQTNRCPGGPVSASQALHSFS